LCHALEKLKAKRNRVFRGFIALKRFWPLAETSDPVFPERYSLSPLERVITKRFHSIALPIRIVGDSESTERHARNKTVDLELGNKGRARLSPGVDR
jgi:hypothetical protein